jgi:predicted phage terminase large subunit-like protein
MVAEVKRHFESNDYLRELFPECCPPKGKKWGTDDSFTCPARTKVFREPTLSSSTLGSVKAGVHVEILAVDDVVNDENASTPAQCVKTIDAFDALSYVLEPGGYTNINGTRYKPWDLYGRLLERDKELRKRIAEQDPEETDDAEVVNFKFTILSAWTVRPGLVLPKDENGVPIVKKDDVELLFPERLKFRSLYKQYRDNPIAFCCQMLNDPAVIDGSERPFTEHLIGTHVIPYTQLPHPAACRDFIMWDLSGVNHANESNDFTVGAVGRLDPKGRLFIIDMVRGKWNATQLAAQIVTLAKNYPSADFTWIEDSQGARMLEPTIMSIANQCGAFIRINWVKIPRFGGAKRYRIDAMAQTLKADKLWFAAFLPHLEVLKAELLDRNPVHDDCSDAIALMVKELNLTSAVPEVEVPTISRREIAQRLFEAAIYGDDNTYVAINPEPEQEVQQRFDAPITGYGFGL